MRLIKGLPRRILADHPLRRDHRRTRAEVSELRHDLVNTLAQPVPGGGEDDRDAQPPQLEPMVEPVTPLQQLQQTRAAKEKQREAVNSRDSAERRIARAKAGLY